jgi:hypothetical protein
MVFFKTNMQNTHTIAMVRPAAFGFNIETADNNHFQDSAQKNNSSLQTQALQQFDAMVQLLGSYGIDVLVLEDNIDPEKPDAIFPNNWFSCNNGNITIYPMYAKNRRTEKRALLIQNLKTKTGITVVNDWSEFEQQRYFLEGTGSMIIDHEHRIIYACLSARTNESLFKKYCKNNNYTSVSFAAADENGNEIYHTNVMMCVGNNFAVVCLNAISNNLERKKVTDSLQQTGHKIVDISFYQMNNFAGNMLQLINKKGEYFLVMSTTAFNSLDAGQITTLKKYSTIITPQVNHIEKAAGGSVRCMMAELFY